MNRTESLAVLARKMMLTVAQAVALPAVIERAALSLEMTEAATIETAMKNSRVCEYLASICRKVTAYEFFSGCVLRFICGADIVPAPRC